MFALKFSMDLIPNNLAKAPKFKFCDLFVTYILSLITTVFFYLQVVMYMSMLYVLVGSSAFAGCGLVLFFCPIQFLMGHSQSSVNNGQVVSIKNFTSQDENQYIIVLHQTSHFHNICIMTQSNHKKKFFDKFMKYLVLTNMLCMF